MAHQLEQIAQRPGRVEIIIHRFHKTGAGLAHLLGQGIFYLIGSPAGFGISRAQTTAHTFQSALGLTRDPYLMTGTDNMWVNVGRSQFHLPTSKAEVLRGRVGVVIPGREALLARLARAKKALEGTRFGFAEQEGFVETVSPWGNVIRVHEPQPGFGPVRLGMPYVELDVPGGTAEGIARFYREIMGAPARVDTVTNAHRGQYTNTYVHGNSDADANSHSDPNA